MQRGGSGSKQGAALQAQLQLQLQLQLELQLKLQLQVHRRQYKRLPQYLASEIKAKFNCEIVIVLLEWPLAGAPECFPLSTVAALPLHSLSPPPLCEEANRVSNCH